MLVDETEKNYIQVVKEKVNVMTYKVLKVMADSGETGVLLYLQERRS